MNAAQAIKKAMDTESKVFIDEELSGEIHDILSSLGTVITPCSFTFNGYDVWLDCNATTDSMEEFVMARRLSDVK